MPKASISVSARVAIAPSRHRRRSDYAIWTRPRIQDLAALRSNRFERPEGDRKGQCSIRINKQWRICFRWTEEGAEDVEIVDYH